MSLSRSLEHHFCLSIEAQRLFLRGARSLCAFGTTGPEPPTSE